MYGFGGGAVGTIRKLRNGFNNDWKWSSLIHSSTRHGIYARVYGAYKILKNCLAWQSSSGSDLIIIIPGLIDSGDRCYESIVSCSMFGQKLIIK